MSFAHTCRGLLQKLKLFYVMNLALSFRCIGVTCEAPEPHHSASVNVKPGHLGTGSGRQNLPPREAAAAVGMPLDLFYEEKPKFVSPEQWAEWKRRYGFAPLGEFCDNCRRVPGKCQLLQMCQDYCAEDCYGHGKDFTTSILCSWCEDAREDRCKDWRSCREHCKLLCLHERYRLKVQADLKREEEQARKRRMQRYEEYVKKREEEDRVWGEKQKTVRRKQLEETRKRLAELAELEYRPPKEEL